MIEATWLLIMYIVFIGGDMDHGGGLKEIKRAKCR